MKKIHLSAVAALGVCLIPAIQADGQTRYNTQPRGNSVRVNGTSTAHDWEMDGGNIGGYIEFGAGVSLDAAQAAPSGLASEKLPVKAHAIIPIGTIHSKAEHLPEVMDDLMQKTMKATDFPRVEFTLKELTFKGPHTAGKPFDFDASGDLVIAGATNQTTFPITIEPMDEGKIKVSGTAAVKMTAYGITPPAPVLAIGTLRCGDDVKISFDWILKEKK